MISVSDEIGEIRNQWKITISTATLLHFVFCGTDDGLFVTAGRYKNAIIKICSWRLIHITECF